MDWGGHNHHAGTRTNTDYVLGHPNPFLREGGDGGGHGLLLPQSFGNGGGMATVICGVCGDHCHP